MSNPQPQLQPRANATLWLLLGVIGVAASAYFYVAPQIQSLSQVRVSTAALAADKQALELRIAEVTALGQRLDQQQTGLDQLALAVPDKLAVDELLVSLQALAASSGIVVSTIQPSAEVIAGGVGISLTARGSYSGIHLFLEQLAKNLRPIKVTDLSLSAASDVAGASLVNVSMQLVAATAGTAQADSKPDQTPEDTSNVDTGGPGADTGGDNGQ